MTFSRMNTCFPMLWERSLTLETDGVYGDLLYVKRRRGCLAQHRYWRSGAYMAGGFSERMDAAASYALPSKRDLREGRQLQNGFWLRGGL